MGYYADSLWGTGDGLVPGEVGGLSPGILNPGAQAENDIFLTGISNAAVNALNIATGAAPTATQQLQFQQSRSTQFMILAALALWFFVGKKA